MVAMKVIRPTPTEGDPYAPTVNEVIRRRFLREASVLAKLQDANVVTVFDYGRIETPTSERERFFMAMELLEGETLHARLERTGRLPQAEAVELLRQMARGLRAAHTHGVVHRDLKPSNLMLVQAPDNERCLKLLDFGVTKVLGEENQDLTEEGTVVGSPRFMSPEQAGGVVDMRSDVYSFGIIAYTMLAGRPPFRGDTAMLTMMQHMNTPLPSLARPELGVSEWLDAIVQQCCEKDPADRFQSAQALLDALETADGARA
jgi:serine/threonine-protein kinase